MPNSSKENVVHERVETRVGWRRETSSSISFSLTSVTRSTLMVSSSTRLMAGEEGERM